jgi:hypothetical protein
VAVSSVPTVTPELGLILTIILVIKFSLCYYILVRIFKNPWFEKFASREVIQDSELKEIVNDVLSTGKADADLGGGVYKVRMARQGEGKSGGYRVLVFFRIKERTFFRYAFAKSAQDNISKEELKTMKKQAKAFFAQTEKQIEKQLSNGTLLEIT